MPRLPPLRPSRRPADSAASLPAAPNGDAVKALTRGERDRTVLLLRCAVWVALKKDYVFGPGWHTADYLGIKQRECNLAAIAAREVARDLGLVDDLGLPNERAKDCDEYITVMLEAAQRIEERSWP